MWVFMWVPAAVTVRTVNMSDNHDKPPNQFAQPRVLLGPIPSDGAESSQANEDLGGLKAEVCCDHCGPSC
jgi:hypothetical protein